MNSPATLTLSGQLRRHAEQRPDAIAYFLPSTGERLSFGELGRAVAALAEGIRAAVSPVRLPCGFGDEAPNPSPSTLGENWGEGGPSLGECAALTPALSQGTGRGGKSVRPQDLSRTPPVGVVILSCSNQLPFPVAFLAILEAGYSVFPISPQAAQPELLRAADESSAVGIIGDDRAVAAIGTMGRFALSIDRIPLHDAQVTRVSPASLPQSLGDLLLQSSGTTGLPKIVRRSGRSLDAAAWAIVDSVGFKTDDRVLMTIPLAHSYGLEHGLLAPVWAGSGVYLMDGLDLPLVLATLGHERITILPGVPSTFEMLARVAAASSAPAPALRRAYSAGAPLPPTVRGAFEERFGTNVTQLYGASEIGSVTYNPPEEPFDSASVGRAMAGVSVQILDLDGTDAPLPVGREGQVAIRAESMFDGYLGAPSGCIDGHFPTGDLGHLDTSGRLFITGRIKLLIDVGGFKVNPLEVEAVLEQHPTVGSCIVVPIRQSATVFRLQAIVTPRDSAVPVDVEALRQLARANLAAYKVPRLFEVRESLPRSPNGKLLRNLPETL